jgi:hypothetical protein
MDMVLFASLLASSTIVAMADRSGLRLGPGARSAAFFFLLSGTLLQAMSAFRGKADIAIALRNAGFDPKRTSGERRCR